MLDLDGFKAFNYTYGHLKGDTVLGAMGQILRSSVRPYDVPCRYGGEEFAVIVPGADASVAREIAERVRLRIAGQVFTETNAEQSPITASFGIACYPEDDSSPDALLQAADRALYEAKRAGGNVIRVYDPHTAVESTGDPPFSMQS